MKKGFTLVELMTVIIILGILALITYPIVDKSIKQSKEKALDRTIKSIIDASYEYSIENDLGYNSIYKKLQFDTLIDAGLLKENIINPVTNQELQGCILYRWIDDYKQYEFEYSETCESPDLTIEDVVLSNFPYLEVGDNGCKNPGNNNYSYMGGCYLKGGSLKSKDILYSFLSGYFGLDDETISTTFFDNEGNFMADNFENYIIPLYASMADITEEEMRQMLEQYNVTMFELLLETTSEAFFEMKDAINNNSLWYSGFLWRIMGINADGTIRLITEENVITIPWGAKDTAQNWDESYIKEWLNDYFYLKLKGNEIITEQMWCSETTEEVRTTRTTCTTNLSKEKSKIGLITLDEYNLPGQHFSYLQIGQESCTMTPNDILQNYCFNGAAYTSGPVIYSDSFRAVINVSSDAIITGGNGILIENWDSEEGPYLLNEVTNVEESEKLNEKSTSGEYVLYAGKKYRIVSKDNNGNTKLILDGYYEEIGDNFTMQYNETGSNIFSTNNGIGQKLNTDVLEWLTNNDEREKEKLVTNYTWYQNEFDYGYNYKISLEEKNPTRSLEATVGLIRIGEMLSGQSSSMLTKNYTVSSGDVTESYWTMTPFTSEYSTWYIGSWGSASKSTKSDKNSIRPVIVIKSNVEIIEGSGTFSNPYKI